MHQTKICPDQSVNHHGCATDDEATWRVFGLGGLWTGEARDETEARKKARRAGVLIISWAVKT